MHAVPLRAHQLLEEASRLSNEAADGIDSIHKRRESQRRTVIEYQYPVDSTSHPVTIPHFSLHCCQREEQLHQPDVFKMDGNQVPDDPTLK
jgi:hypothetical protein